MGTGADLRSRRGFYHMPTRLLKNSEELKPGYSRWIVKFEKKSAGLYFNKILT